MAVIVADQAGERNESADERLALLVRSLGITDEPRVHVEAGRLADRLLRESPVAGAAPARAVSVAEARVILLEWLEQIVPPADCPHPHAHDLLLFRLNSALALRPECLLQVPPEADELRAAIRACRVPVLPSECPAEMPVQDLSAKPRLSPWFSRRSLRVMLGRLRGALGSCGFSQRPLP
jgi:hypothetical protein